VTFVPFELERWQSAWENRVRINLSESGVHPLSIRELLDLSDSDPADLAALRLGYSQSNGTDELRAAIAALYPGATPEHVLVTVGSAEANFVSCWALISPGDRVTIQTPAYLQTWGLAHNFGARVSTLPLREELGWEPDLEEIEHAIPSGTALVVVTNPNNPTGHILSRAAREAILARVRAVGAWLLADEVYQGAERNGETTPSFWGQYDRLLVTNGLSKAYGLPGLRLGWVVGPADLIERLWRRHDYTVIGPTPMSDFLARAALKVRPRILARTRRILNENYPVLARWLESFGPLFQWHPPEAGAICLARYRHTAEAADVVERIRARHDILLVPGEHFGLDHHIRFGYGNPAPELEEALAALERPFREMTQD
jgi:aspartate/methionine/tyrosine aminotransferase